MLKRDLESALGVSARVESQRTGLLDKAVPCTIEADGTVQSTFSRLRRLECRLMRRDAVNISIRSFSKKRRVKKGREGKVNSHGYLHGAVGGMDNTTNWRLAWSSTSR